ncbi:MAG: InlB B-repeat-containing protein [Christensenellales bacterium]|jgi:uncharacterized repeat protein (TIGR02543 family)
MLRDKRWLALGLAFVLLFTIGVQTAGASADAQVRPKGAANGERPKSGVLTGNKAGLSKAKKKLGSDLLALLDENGSSKDTLKAVLAGEMQEQGRLSQGKVTDDRGLMQTKAYVYIQLEPGADPGAVQGAVSKVVSRDEEHGLIAAWVKLSALEALAANAGVKTVQTVLPPVVNAGSVTSEGDSVLKAELARLHAKTDGTGVRVGVISDGVDNLASAVASKDLPTDVTVLSNAQGGDEGTAMLEIVHDLAPGAKLYFHDCGSNVIEFNQAIDHLVAAGCTVVCDDISWITQPFFEDGVVAAHVKELVEEDRVVYVTSAGNAAMRHYQGRFHDDGIGLHDFSGGTSGYMDLYVRIPAGGQVIVVLGWNEPFGASGNDYDLYLTSLDYGTIYASSGGVQSGSGDPLEAFSYTNPGPSAKTAAILVQACDTPSPRTLEVYIYGFGGAYNYTDNTVAADSVMGQAAVPGVLACGAVDADTPDEIEGFSSRGPVTMLNGTRPKPDVCATDGVSVTGAGGFSNPFYGTSASAPHVAAVAALVQSKRPALTASQVRECIVDSAADLGASGFDTVYGNGLVDALAATGTFYTVRFDSRGGSAVKSLSALEGTKIRAPKPPTRSGYMFGGWYKNAQCTSPWSFDRDRVASNITLYAKWLVRYTVSAAPNSAAYGTVTGAGPYAAGSKATLRAKPKAGYRFVCWREGSSKVSSSAAYTFTVTKNRTLKAEFARIGRPAAKAASASYNGVRVSWGAVKGASGYEVCRTSSAGSVYSRVTTTSTGYTRTGLSTGSTYYYKVRAFCISGGTKTYGRYSSLVKAKPVPARPVAKAAPVSYNGIRISWNAVKGASGYEVCRTSKSGSTVYARARTTSKSYTSTGRRTGLTYTFKVRAYRMVNGKRVYGRYSSLVKAKPVPARPVAKAASVSYNGIRISWNAVRGASGYEVCRTSKSGATVYARARTTSRSYTSTGRRTGLTYTFKVRAYRMVNGKRVYGRYSSLVKAKPLPARPVAKAAPISKKSIRVSWNAVRGASGYEVCRTSKSGATVYGRIFTRSRSYVNTGRRTGTTYYYKVRAYRKVDGKRVCGRFSAVVKAKT